MSASNLIIRQRAQSTVSLRKRLVRPNSEDKKSQQLKKSSTMTSFRPKLERLIQEGKIDQIMNQDPSSKTHLLYLNHVNQMEKELASTKKSLSTFVIKSRNKQQSINILKNDIRKVEREIEILKQEALLASKKYSGMNEDLQNKKSQHENIYWNQKMSAYMRDRGYKDQVFLKARYEGLQNQFDVEMQNRKLLQDKYHELKQTNKQLARLRNEAKAIADQQARDKTQYISLLEGDMSERDLLGDLKAQKHKRQGQINQIAPSLIERQQLEKILEVLHSHRILSQIIRTKSNNLLKKYEKINHAYNHIKSNSNITQPEKILKRMEEHDKIYDDAVKRVNALQGELNHLQSELQKCLLAKNQILSIEGKTQMHNKGYYQGLQKDKYELLISQKEKLEQRNKNDQVLRKNILNWSVKMFTRFNVNQSQNNNFLDCLTDLVVRIRQQK